MSRTCGRWRLGHVALIALLSVGTCVQALQAQDQLAGEQAAVLAKAPRVPPPITRRQPTKVVVRLETQEVVLPLADGVAYAFWTFGGAVPGSFIRVREGDLVEFHLSNHPSSRFPHNIDLHAVTGPGGGAASSITAPGHTTVFAFRAESPGLYVYHCATAPVGMHIANGMYGLILVEPKEGLPRVDREYYVMQGEVYTLGFYGDPGTQRFSMEKALSERPDYVVFNGAVGSLQGDRALTAAVGQSVRLFVGNGGPNLFSAFHLIGGIFDRVYPEGGSAMTRHVQTTLIPPGGAAIVEFTARVPGTYLLVDHAVFRAFNKGALAQLTVTGPADNQVYRGRLADEVYQLEGVVVQTLPPQDTTPLPAPTAAEKIELGKRVFTQICQACHQSDGRGVPGAFPPLAGSDFLNADARRAIGILLKGLQGEVTVNGRTYNGVMPAVRLSDDDIANVLTYVYSQWGNAGVVVTRDEVRTLRICPWCFPSDVRGPDRD